MSLRPTWEQNIFRRLTALFRNASPADIAWALALQGKDYHAYGNKLNRLIELGEMEAAALYAKQQLRLIEEDDYAGTCYVRGEENRGRFLKQIYFTMRGEVFHEGNRRCT